MTARRPSAPLVADAERARAALDTLEEAHNLFEQIEALAFVVAESLHDVRFVASDEGARVGNRRFSRLVGLLADTIEDARLSVGEQIDEIVHGHTHDG
jgi:hypothetical protein